MRALIAGLLIACLMAVFPPAKAVSCLPLMGVGGACGAAASGLMLDGISTGVKSCYSTRRLLTAYAANKAIRVQRISDNTQMDIGFVSNILDTATLATFSSGTTSKIATWYDQCGAGLDVINNNGTISQAPIIYQSGAVNAINSKPAILFVAANSTYLSNTTGSCNPNPVNTLFQNAVLAANTSVFGAVEAGNGSGKIEWRIDSGGTQSILSTFTANIATSSSGISSLVGAVTEMQYNSTSGAYSFWLNAGSTGTGTSIITFSSLNSCIFGSSTLGSNDQFDGSIGEVVNYDLVGGIPSGSRTAIEANQKAFWGTP